MTLLLHHREGLLKLLKALPVFSSLSFPQLERLCAMCYERTYGNKDVVCGSGSGTGSGPEGTLDGGDDKTWIVW